MAAAAGLEIREKGNAKMGGFRKQEKMCINYLTLSLYNFFTLELLSLFK